MKALWAKALRVQQERWVLLSQGQRSSQSAPGILGYSPGRTNSLCLVLKATMCPAIFNMLCEASGTLI